MKKVNLSYLFDRADLLEEGMGALLGWLAAGSIRPHSVEVFPMAGVAEAHRRLESGTTVGKLVLSMLP